MNEIINNQIDILKRIVIGIAETSQIKIEEKSADFNDGFKSGVTSVGVAIVCIINELEKRLEDGIEQA